MNRSLLLFLLLWFAGIPVCAQKILLAASDGNIYSYSIDAANRCVIQQVTNPCTMRTGETVFSIALFKDTLYYNTAFGALYRTIIGDPAACKLLTVTASANSLTADKNGMLYFVTGDELHRFDPHTLVDRSLGRVPSPSSGDLVFFNDKLYLASAVGLLEVNIESPLKSKTVLTTPGHSFFGLISIPVGCDKNIIYGIEPRGTGQSALVEIDLENAAVLNTFCTLPINVYDAASITESGVRPGITLQGIDIKPGCAPGEKGSLQVNATTAVSNVSLMYSANNSVANSTGTFADLIAGQYNIHIQSSDGCRLDATVQLPTPEKISVALTITADTCGTQNGTLSIQRITGGNTLSFVLPNKPSQTAPLFTGLPGGDYLLGITDEYSCTASVPFEIKSSNPPMPLTNIKIEPAGSCGAGDGSIQFNYLTGVNITGARLDNGAFLSTDIFTNISAGDHHLQIKTSTCLYDTVLNVPLKNNTAPTASFVNKPPDCLNSKNGSSVLTLSNIATPYTVSFNGGAYGPFTQFTGLAAGVYNVVVKDARGCEWPMTSTVPPYQYSKPQTQVTTTDAECIKPNSGAVRISISGVEAPYQFQWGNSRYASGSEVKGLLPGTYIAGIFNANNCKVDSATITINLNANGTNCDTIYVPSGFTPNNDGKNDELRPIGYPLYQNIQGFVFRIFHRYGQVLFETHTAGKSWDGKFKGQPQPTGVYVWIVELIDPAGQKRIYKGTTTLIR
jgi:gliding motility-associated-like protein